MDRLGKLTTEISEILGFNATFIMEHMKNMDIQELEALKNSLANMLLNQGDNNGN